MTTLSGLTFSVLPETVKSPTIERRMKLLKKLDEQHALALDPAATKTVKKRIVAEDGSSRVVQQSRNIRPWWKESPSGGWFLTVRFGGRPLEFEKGKAAISFPNRSDLVSVIESLIAATKAGELDGLLAQQVRPKMPAKTKRSAS